MADPLDQLGRELGRRQQVAPVAIMTRSVRTVATPACAGRPPVTARDPGDPRPRGQRADHGEGDDEVQAFSHLPADERGLERREGRDEMKHIKELVPSAATPAFLDGRLGLLQDHRDQRSTEGKRAVFRKHHRQPQLSDSRRGVVRSPAQPTPRRTSRKPIRAWPAEESARIVARPAPRHRRRAHRTERSSDCRSNEAARTELTANRLTDAR